MHPLIAHLHPSHRTALGAWLLSRLLLWGIAARDSSIIEAMLELLARSQTTPVVGLLLAGWSSILAHIGAPIWGIAIVPVLIAELVLLAAFTGIYSFSRHDHLPLVAERATWLWAFSPLMVFTTQDLSWSLGIGLGTIALTAAARGRHLIALLAMIIAMGSRLEFVLLWPAIAAIGWTSFHDGRHKPWARWLTAIGPLAAFSGWILFAMSMAGRVDISLRSLQTEGTWRMGFAWQGLEEHTPELLLAAAALMILALCLRSWRSTPKHWLLAIAPLVLWPFLHNPIMSALPILLWALPTFVHAAEATDNPSIERPVLLASVVGLVWFAMI